MAVCTPPQVGISPRPASRATASQFLASTGSLALQVSGPGRPSRLVRIRSAKCTVGSAPGCTLRLRADGVGAIHCWILRGDAGTVIRRMNGVATFNGAHFDEALLNVGDRVTLGSVEFVVAECNAALPFEQIPVAAAARSDGEVLELQAKLDTALQQIKRLEAESRQGFESSIMAAERADQLRDAIAEANQQLEEVCSELAAAQDTIASQKLELETQSARLSSHENSAQSAGETIQRLESTAAAASAHCESLASQLHDLQTAQTEENANWIQERTQLTQRCEQLMAELQSARAEQHGRSDAATIAFDQHALIGAATDVKLSELTEQLATKQAEIESLRRELDGQSVVTGRLEQLTCDYDHKCREVNDLQARCEELSSRSLSTQDLEQKSQSLAQLEADLASREGTIATTAQALDGEKAVLIAKSQELEATRNDLATEQQRLADLRRELEQSQASLSEFEQCRSELDQRASQLESRSAEIESQATTVANRAAELDSRLGQLDARGSELDARAAELERQAAELASKAAEQCQAPIPTIPFAQIESQSAELDAKTAELASRDAEIAKRVAEVNDLLEQLVDQRAALASREQELCERQSVCESRLEEINQQATQLAALRDDLRTRSEQLAEQEALALRNAADRQACEPAPQMNMPIEPSYPTYAESGYGQVAEPSQSNSNDGPTPSDDPDKAAKAAVDDEAEMNSVLSRLVQAGVWRQEDSQGTEAPAFVAAEAPPPEAGVEEIPNDADEPLCSTMVFESPEPVAPVFARPQMPSASVSDDEESIESYMDRLMKRVRGDGGAGQSSWKASSSLAPPASAPTPEPVAAPEPTPAISDSQPAEYSPRRTAPELSTNLSAMRDLANSAARTAIDQHIRQHTSRRATKRLFGAFVIVGLSVAMAYWAWRIHSFQAGLGAGLGCAIGSYWTMMALRRLSGLKRLDRETVQIETQAVPDLGLPPKTPTNG